MKIAILRNLLLKQQNFEKLIMKIAILKNLLLKQQNFEKLIMKIANFEQIDYSIIIVSLRIIFKLSNNQFARGYGFLTLTLINLL